MDLKPSVELFLTTQGEVQEKALRTLLGSGRAALPPLEAALHRTEPKERRAALLALRRIGLQETVPLLGHVAQFDADPGVRADAGHAGGLRVGVAKGHRPDHAGEVGDRL